MKKYRFLALTDHSGHSKENSLYALMSTLVKHPQCEKVSVVSRGNTANDSFFKDCKNTALLGIEVSEKFDFQVNGIQFLENLSTVNVTDYDVLIMRLPRPISSDFFHFIAKIGQDKVIINHPLGIERTSTKAFLLNFPELSPPMKLCHSIKEILEFAQQFPIVLKPLKEYGGKGIVKVQGDKVFINKEKKALAPYLKKIEEQIITEGYLAMKFLKNVTQGDKRIIVVNGKILAASLRLPPKDSWLCNIAQGGSSVIGTITPEEEHIIKTITPKLLEEGILIYGADTLTNDNGKRILSEINTLSIGGFPQAERQTGQPVLQQTIEAIMDYVKATKNKQTFLSYKET